jgi:glycosyltransferase 2 family protein
MADDDTLHKKAVASMKRGARSYQSWLGFAVSLAFLYLALRNVQWGEVWASIRTARLELLLVGTAILYTGWLITALRWKILLYSSPGLRVRDTFAYIAIGYLANSVLPMRLGELARATLLGRKKGIGISRVLGSIALERVLDLLTVIAVAMGLALLMDIPPAIQTGVITLAAGGFGALLFLAVLAFHQEQLHRFTVLLGKIVPDRIAGKVMTLIHNFSAGAGVLRRPTGVLSVCGLSLLAWGLYGVSTWLATRAFHLPIPWYGAVLVLVVVNLGSAIPSSPGYVGVYHYLAVLALSVWMPDRNAALAYAIGSHALNILINVSMGSFCLTKEGLSLQSLKSEMASGASQNLKQND